MKKLYFIIGSLALTFSCRDKIDTNSKTTDSNKNYNIETITYWDTPNATKDTIPFIVVKVDTINHIGSSVRYSQEGKVFERIVILDKNKAVKVDYDADTIALITPCKYFVRKDHPTKDIYSIVAYK